MGTYLVTGGAGFIGSNIVDGLLARGETVRVIDNLSTGRLSNTAGFIDRVKFLEADICDAAAVDEAVRGVDYVIHQAALASVPRSIADPTANNQVNVQGTLNLLEAAVTHNVKRMVYASSSSVYGDSEQLPKIETMAPNPKSPYAVAKLAAEYYCGVFSALHGLSTIALRYFNVFGPRQDPNSDYSAVIPLFVRSLLEGNAPTIHGDGEQSRDFTFIDNVVSANMMACDANITGARVYNIACGDRLTLNHLYDTLRNKLGIDLESVHGPDRAGDVKHSMADITKISGEIGYKPTVSFEDGIDRTIKWYQEVGLKALG